MSQFSTNQTKKQDGTGTLHVGIDLALEKNVCVVTNGNGEKLDYFSFPQARGGYDYFLKRVKMISQKQCKSRLVVAMEPSNYFWKLMARELEELTVTMITNAILWSYDGLEKGKNETKTGVIIHTRS